MKSVMFIIAHPDDETITSAGTIALFASRGIDAHIACATRGEGGELGDPPVCTREGLPAVREAELRCAAGALGASGVTFLGYVDPLIGPDDELFAFEMDFDTLAGQLKALIRKHAPDMVMTHGADGEYGHPAHILMHQAVRVVVESLTTPPLLYTFAARVPGMEDHLWNQNEPAHLALDIRPWLDAKEAALQCHKSQHALFLRKRQGQTLREAARKVEAYHRHLPRLDEGEPPRDSFADLLRAAGAWEPAHPNNA
jgi:LmbE family N-acetylglucosaminyl deacetylase